MNKKEVMNFLNKKMQELHVLGMLLPDNIDFPTWCQEIEIFLHKSFGKDSVEYTTFKDAGIIRGIVEDKGTEYHKALRSRESALASIIFAHEKLGDEEPLTQKDRIESPIQLSVTSSKETWKAIENEYDEAKWSFGKKINFVSDSHKRKTIFRDVEHSFVLASLGFSKPAVILAGGVIEELLRLYLEHKNITPINNNFDGYIQTCEQEGLLKKGISRLSDSARYFRNLVHLAKEETKQHTISKPMAKGAVASIFTIANDF